MKQYATAIIVFAAVAMMPSTALAQLTEPEPASVRRPYRGLFAPPADVKSGRPSLDANFSVFGAYDDDVYAEQGTTGTDLPEAYRPAGWYSGATAGLVFNKPGQKVAFNAGAEVGINRFREREDFFGSYRTAADLSVLLAARTRLEAGGSFGYHPEYRLGLFLSPDSLTGSLDPFATIAPDLDIYELRAYRGVGQVTLSQGFGRRGSLSGWYVHNLTNYDDNQFDYRSQSGGGRYQHQLTQHTAGRFGYFYSKSEYQNQSSLRPQEVHNIDVGVDYSRALSFSRRTTVGFSTGSAMLLHDDLSSPDVNRNFSFQIIGSANLNHEIGRTWTAQAGYRRGVDFHEGFNEAFLSDAVSVGTEGLLNRRTQFRAGADYAWGTVGLGTDNHFDSLSGSAEIEFGLSKNIALYTRYIYYHYDFDENVALDPRFVRALDRQGVRFGLTAWVPIVR